MHLAEVFFLPLLIGIGHSLEVDHLVAVGNLVNVKGNWSKEALRGATWGLGHTVSIALAAAAISFLRMWFGQEEQWPFEILVGIMLVVIGILKLYRTMGKNSFPMSTASKSVFFQVGLVHGLAGSGSVAALLSGHASSIPQQYLFLAWFGIGTMIGMAAIAALLTQTQIKHYSFVRTYSVFIASLSVIYGLTILYQQTLKPFMS